MFWRNRPDGRSDIPYHLHASRKNQSHTHAESSQIKVNQGNSR
jgi:hypothetical protein